MEDLKKEKNILRITRTKETYRSKISSQSKGSQSGMKILEKYNATENEKTWFLGLV